MKKRLLSTLLALCMVLVLLPGSAWAENATTVPLEDTLTYESLSYEVNNGAITIVNCDAAATSVTIPAQIDGVSVTSIRSYAFSMCDKLVSVTIPDSVTEIEPKVFDHCTKLKSITIPSGVTSIGAGAFHGCNELTGISVAAQNTSYTSEDGILFNKIKTEILCYPAGKSGATTYTIPNSVTSISESAFSGCSQLTSIDVPSGVTYIGGYAFSGCSGLTSIIIPSGIPSIGYCAFENCDGLTSVIIPDGTITIGGEAFRNCDKLTSVTIPKSVLGISADAFRDCNNRVNIHYAGGESDWASITIEDGAGNSASLQNVVINYNSTGGGGGETPDPGPDVPQPSEYKVYCSEGSETFTVSLEECIAKTISTTYNPQLAHMLIAMCNSVYDSNNMQKTLDSFGFQKISQSETIYLNYSIAVKQLEDGTSLALVSVRGTGGFLDDLGSWASNVHATTNSSGQHQGFADAANDLYDSLTRLLQTGGSTIDFSKTKFVITGFSRGAAAANILSARLVDERVPQANVYAYTFACPDTAKITTTMANNYQCIFNIANANDFVSWVPRTILGDTWEKYGQSYWYSSVWDDYAALEMGTAAHNQVRYLNHFRLETPITGYRQRSAAKEALDYAAEWRNDKFWSDVKSTLLGVVGIHCPVNVDIYASGSLVGSVTNGLVEINDADKVYIVLKGGNKDIYLLSDDTYTFNLTATDEDTMTYSVQNIEVATKNVVSEQMFENVALSYDKRFTSQVKVENDIVVEVETEDVKLYVLGDTDQPVREVLPDGNGTEVPITVPTPVAYTITLNANGGTVGSTSLTTDVSGKLSALPTPTRSGYAFNGWFTASSGGTAVTTNTVFSSTATIYAQWTAVGGGDNTSGGGSSGGSPSGGGYSSPTYSITAATFTGGKVAISPKSASKGTTVTITTAPDTGYELVSVTVSDGGGKVITLTDKGNGKYTFTMPSGKVTVDAIFQPVQTAETPWNNPFTDIAEGDWYYDAVRFAQENGLMSGYGNGVFAPNANLSRAMLAQILYNKEGKPTVAGSTFSDVVDGAWYADAVTWAAKRGIVSGYGNGRFGPNDNITREQLAVMLWRYSGAPAAIDKELHFADADTASSYARDALCWAVENGIINGYGGGTLGPRGQATRAQVAQMLMNYLRK